MKPAPRRHRVSEHLAPSDANTLRSRQDAVLETVFAPEADGLAAWCVRAMPGSLTYAPAPDQGGGQYVIVTAGSLLHEGNYLDRLSCVYVSVTEPALPLQAGADGLEAFIMQFPVAEARPPQQGKR